MQQDGRKCNKWKNDANLTFILVWVPVSVFIADIHAYPVIFCVQFESCIRFLIEVHRNSSFRVWNAKKLSKKFSDHIFEFYIKIY